MPQPQPRTTEILALLRREFGADLITDAEGLLARSRDESGLVRPPVAVLLARSEAQVARLMTLANKNGFPVIPRGAGTGLAGGCLAGKGGVVLDLAAMNRILAIDTQSLTATVQPGVITADLRDAAKAVGLFYPPDPASLATSTIGGNAATNAGGPACVKYGTTRDYVLGLTAVLPTGEVIRAGANTRKGVVGYDLTRLLVGSEGTLGVITELTLKLIPHPRAAACVAAVFADLNAAMRAIISVMTRGHLPSAMEFLDARCLKLVGDLLPFSVAGEQSALVLIESDGDPDQVRREVAGIEAICRELGATNILPPATTDEGREAVWAVRRSVSTRIHEDCAVYIPEDIAVPIGRIADMVAALPEVEERFGITIFVFGHAGDGNIHLNLTAQDEALRPKVEAAAVDCVRLALKLGGTISGEHGIGLVKRGLLPLEIGPVSLRVQRGIKALLDPQNVLNPGKIFPPEGAEDIP
ncbi:MAG: FAD/FMN-containing dehydrogenase [Deltaproteobacteria bacterium HGW-Deltaproteobacteria-8]|jgi:D-lactate dehydrogenase (cytochrome)|nr:MAG: FAD/FMN-containing dehydrogenase [Deltaproteobacteria bacterium HGW-Deltaproteobacteria-8]